MISAGTAAPTRRPRTHPPVEAIGQTRGAERAAALYSLIETAKLNGLDPETYLTDVLARIAGHPARRLAALLPWHWVPLAPAAEAA